MAPPFSSPSPLTQYTLESCCYCSQGSISSPRPKTPSCHFPTQELHLSLLAVPPRDVHVKDGHSALTCPGCKRLPKLQLSYRILQKAVFSLFLFADCRPLIIVSAVTPTWLAFQPGRGWTTHSWRAVKWLRPARLKAGSKERLMLNPLHTSPRQ